MTDQPKELFAFAPTDALLALIFVGLVVIGAVILFAYLSDIYE